MGLAVDDIVSDVISQNNNASNYQPAAGVEVEIRFLMVINSTDGRIHNYDGTNTLNFLDGNGLQNQICNLKIGITNTNYLRFASINAVAVTLSYSGIQVK